MMYTLSFSDAIDKMIDREGFAIGEQFAIGCYLTIEDSVIRLKQRTLEKTFPYDLGCPILSIGLLKQKYKIIPVANNALLGLK